MNRNCPIGRLTLLAFLGLMFGCATTPWVSRTPSDDADYRYYVGRSFDLADKNRGLDLARDDAKEKATEENFGAQYRFRKDVSENITGSQAISQSASKSKSVHLEEFVELELSQAAGSDDNYNTFVLFRYSKKAIDREKTRLAQVTDPLDEKLEALDIPDKNHLAIPQYESQNSIRQSVGISYAIGASTCPESTTMKNADNSTLSYCLTGDLRFGQRYSLFIQFEFGNKSTNYTNGNLELTRYDLRLGMPFYLKKIDISSWTPFIMPGISADASDFKFQSSGGSATEVTKIQYGAILDFGVQLRLATWSSSALSSRISIGGLQPILNDSKVTGESSMHGAATMVLEFGK